MAQIIAIHQRTDMTDDELIDACAAAIKARMGEINAAEKYIAIGAEFSILKDGLTKRSKSDDQREGWLRAFSLKPARFDFGRRSAEMFIAIHEFIGGNSIATNNLPSSWIALYELTVSFKNRLDLLNKLLDENKINPTTSREAIIELAGGRKPPRGGRSGRIIQHEPPKPRPPAERRAALMVLDKKMTHEQAKAQTGLGSTMLVKLAIAREEGRREAQPASLVSPDELKIIEAEAARRAAEQREADKQAKADARQARRSARREVEEPTKPLVMFGQQVWPLPKGSPAYYSYDQLFFGGLFFLGWKSLFGIPTDTRELAISMRTRLKFLHMFVDRRFSPGDEKTEMTGFLTVFEMLCDLYRDNPHGECDTLHDICIQNDSF